MACAPSRVIALLAAGLVAWGVSAPGARGEQAHPDPTLVLHYTFDEDTGEVAKDLSGYGNHGKIVKAQYLPEFDGRQGVLRFDGESSYINCGDAESLRFEGDMTFEMWVRLNQPVEGIQSTWAYIFGENPIRSFYFTVAYWHTLTLWYRSGGMHGLETAVAPVDRHILSEEWSHIAVVVEYPRCRFYHNGELVRDAYLPVPAIAKLQNTPKHIGGKEGAFCTMDLDEFRLYRRALTAEEVAAHARGEEAPPGQSHELAVEPYWYEDRVALRLSCKGVDYSGHSAEMTILDGRYQQLVAPRRVPLKEAFEGCGRYVAEASFPLSELAGKSVDGVARILSPDGKQVRTVFHHASLKKPEWVFTREGYYDGVLPPWTPVEAKKKPDGTVEVRVWGRRYVFGETPFLREVETKEAKILAAPISLKARADGRAIAWTGGRPTLKESGPKAAVVEQVFDDDRATLRVSAKVEYDGYAIFDCEVKARQDLGLEELTLDIPLRTRYATLCYGDRVLPPNPKIPIAEWYGGAVGNEDHAWRFSGNIWLGDEERGLCWQAESDEYWCNSDRQRAIEILPRGEVTTFRAHLVDVPTRLAKGQALHYKFALAATPFKPLLRDSWDLRIARSEPYGGDLAKPDRQTDGKPALQHHAEAGVRHLFINVNDIWPYPMPVHKKFSNALHRLVNETHAHGLRLYPYLIHERYPVMAPEFDLHGLHMSNRPLRAFIPGMNRPGNPRPGPVTMKYGAGSQGTVMFCAKSRALQDAVVHSLARRLDEYGDDGVYLDGTGVQKPCQNLAHGCGYRTEDGSIRPTYPVFANREFLRRIYTVVKTRRPEGVVDVHNSFGINMAGLAYADVLWTGEQWHHLRLTGAKHIPSELTLDKFRAEFMGRQFGVAAETLAYRLGPQMKVAAISLLHDIPNRPNTPGFDEPNAPRRAVNYFGAMVKLWKVRDEFGAKEAEKLFYWENQDYVKVSPENCYSTLLKHPKNGVLAFLTNLRRDAATVEVRFNLDKLGLAGRRLEAVNVLTGEPVEIAPDGRLSLHLGSVEWTYVWLRPSAGE